MELSTGAYFFTTNDNFYGGQTQRQDPLWTSQAHATYNIVQGVWVALSFTYDHGGRTTVNGTRNNDIQNNSRLGATLALPVNKNNSIKLYGSVATQTSVGNDFDIVGILWQYRWGGGL